MTDPPPAAPPRLQSISSPQHHGRSSVNGAPPLPPRPSPRRSSDTPKALPRTRGPPIRTQSEMHLNAGSSLSRIPEGHPPHHQPPPLPPVRRPKGREGSLEGSPSPLTPHPPHTPIYPPQSSRSSASPAPHTPTHHSHSPLHSRSSSTPSVIPPGSSLSHSSHAANAYEANIPPGDTYVTASRGSSKTVTDDVGNHRINKVSANHFKPIEEQEWYWGSTSKEYVTEIMKDMPDGSFLVRDAARVHGYYTLTLRKGGVNRLIRIMHRGGLYGFAEPLEFSTVMELIEYYKHHSLAPYSPKLDITLMKPVSHSLTSQLTEDDWATRKDAQEITPDSVLDSLRSIEQHLKEKSNKYNELKTRFEWNSEELKPLRQEIAAQNEITTIMKDGLKEHEKHHETTPTPLKAILLQNYELLRRRYRLQRDSHDMLQQKLTRMEMVKNSIEQELNNLKPEIKRLQAEKGNKVRWLNQRGWDTSDIISRIQPGATEGEDPDNPEEGLYATYAMLHTYRNEADYMRISEEIVGRRKSKPPPLPPSDSRSPAAVMDGTLARPPPRDRLRTRTDTVLTRPTPHLESHDSFDGQLISYKQLQLSSDLPHFDQSTWMNPAISREDSRDRLLGKPNGTFLVRPKGVSAEEIPANEPLHCHTIDIVDGGKFKRIPVFRGPGGGFGFAPPFEFDSLLSLVLYYATNTMEKHNPDLETTLRHPAFSRR